MQKSEWPVLRGDFRSGNSGPAAARRAFVTAADGRGHGGGEGETGPCRWPVPPMARRRYAIAAGSLAASGENPDRRIPT